MFSLADRTGYIDVNFRGVPGLIAAGVLIDSDDVSLVDPGPTSCLSPLRRSLAARGIGTADIRRILLTHVHRSLSAGADPDAQFAAFGEAFREYARGFLLEADAAAYQTVSPLRYNWNGLERYWMKHAAAANA